MYNVEIPSSGDLGPRPATELTGSPKPSCATCRFLWVKDWHYHYCLAQICSWRGALGHLMSLEMPSPGCPFTNHPKKQITEKPRLRYGMGQWECRHIGAVGHGATAEAAWESLWDSYVKGLGMIPDHYVLGCPEPEPRAINCK